MKVKREYKNMRAPAGSTSCRTREKAVTTATNRSAEERLPTRCSGAVSDNIDFDGPNAA